MERLRQVILVLYLFIFQFSTLYAAEIATASGTETASEIATEMAIETATEKASETATEMTTKKATESAPISAPILTGASAVLIDAETGIVLYDKEMDTQRYPASITKIMTALLTLELCEDLDAPLVFSHEAVFSLPPDASHIAMNEGEIITLYDALHGLLLSSANEVANALAEHIAGSVADFAVLMNKRAEALGATNTHFTNPSGLHADDHYTTAKDMALILQEAVKHPVFCEIIATLRYDIPPTALQEQPRELLNTNRLIQSGLFFNEWVVGGKTGFTDEAQRTLVAYAVKDGRSLIASVMYDGRDAVFADINALFDFGFGVSYTEQTIFDSTSFTRVVPVFQQMGNKNTAIGEVTIKGARDFTYLLPKGHDPSAIRYDISIPESLSPPVKAGDEVGFVTCYAGDVLIGVVKLTAVNAVAALYDGAQTLNPSAAADSLASSSASAAVAVSEGTASASTSASTSASAGTANNAGTAPLSETASDIRNMSTTGETSETSEALLTEYLSTLAVPLGISCVALLVSLILFLTRRRRKRAQILRFDRYTRYNGRAYRYR